MAQLVNLYKQFRCTILAVQEVPEAETEKYGVIAGEALDEQLIRVTDMVEKPAPSEAPSNLAVIGRYVLTPDIFDIIASTEAGKNDEVAAHGCHFDSGQEWLCDCLQISG